MMYRTYFAYCSARDQKVRVVRRSEVLMESTTEDPYPSASDVVCLEYGARCTGAICPLFDVPSAEMVDRLAEAGLI